MPLDRRIRFLYRPKLCVSGPIELIPGLIERGRVYAADVELRRRMTRPFELNRSGIFNDSLQYRMQLSSLPC